MKLALTFVCSITLFAAWAQHTPLTSTQAYEYLQHERKKADAFVGTGLHTDSLKRAERILNEALVYYQRPQVQELAKTNSYLFARKGDILFDLAGVQARLNQPTAAAQSLQEPLTGKYASVYANALEQEPVFSKVLSLPAITLLVSKAKAANRVFNSEALKTPYTPNISEDEKVAGLSKLWSEAKYNFAYFDHIPDVDWDQVYLQYLPKVRATKSTLEYLRVLQSFASELHDGHTDVWTNDPALSDSIYRQPPIASVLIEDKVLIQFVRSDSLQKSGIRPMMEIVQIDGLPVHDYANQYVKPYVSGSTTQNVNVATYTYRLLRGSRNRPIRLTIRDQAGKEFSRTLPRIGYSNVRSTPAFEFKILPGNIAYVALNHFESDQALNGFAAAFDSIAHSRALILDVRQNGGGDSGYGWNVLGYLTDKSMQTGSYASRLYSPLRRARGESVVFESLETDTKGWSPHGKKLYTKPVVVLTSGRTFSAAEDFAVVFDAMKRGTIIGEPTGGSTGQPLVFALPGGIMARVCTKRDMYPDGTEWNAKGIQPQIYVKPTVADWQKGRDTVLEAALSFLKGK